ncbi:MAG: radical SAM protein, partial [Pseudomonadota bacterium]
MPDPLHTRPRGRGTDSNRAGRFETFSKVVESDGWDLEEELPPLRTEVQIERPRRIITRNQSPDISFDRSV